MKAVWWALLMALLWGMAGAQAQTGRVYTPGAFTRLEIDGSARIRLSQGEHDLVVIAGGDEVQRDVEVELVDQQLRIRAGGGWKFWRGERPVIDVQMRHPDRVVLSGAGDLQAPGPIRCEQLSVSISGAGSVRFDELAVGQLRFDISGAGEGQLAGRVEQLNVSVSGKGKVMADQLRAARARVSISGVGNADLWVVDDLQLDISGAGKVDYWGTPVVRRSVSGVGSVSGRGAKP